MFWTLTKAKVGINSVLHFNLNLPEPARPQFSAMVTPVGLS